jgi:hypothetical protein
MIVRCSIASTLGGVISSNIDAKFLLTCIISVTGCLNGVVGAGCINACVRSAAAMASASALEIPGTL